jgi:hypothetical protein
MPDDVNRCIRCGAESALQYAPTAQKSAAAPDVPERPLPTGRIGRGWMLAKLSLRVLKEDRSLLVFPLLSGIACLLVLATFIGGWFVIPGATVATGDGQRDLSTLGWLMLFAYYFVNYFVIVFFNAALVSCAMMRFSGEVPTVGAGLRIARARIVNIAAWALLAATVGVVLKMIEERVALVGRIVIALVGAAWTIGCYFVVPVLVVEDAGPIDAFKRSVGILKKAWGESIVSNTGLGLIVFLSTIVLLVVVGMLTVVLGASGGGWFALVTGGVLMAAVVVLAALVGSALNAIVLSALYIYATEGKLPAAFSGSGLQHAFVAK